LAAAVQVAAVVREAVVAHGDRRRSAAAGLRPCSDPQPRRLRPRAPGLLLQSSRFVRRVEIVLREFRRRHLQRRELSQPLIERLVRDLFRSELLLDVLREAHFLYALDVAGPCAKAQTIQHVGDCARVSLEGTALLGAWFFCACSKPAPSVSTAAMTAIPNPAAVYSAHHDPIRPVHRAKDTGLK
jgi:hypothetical protein